VSTGTSGYSFSGGALATTFEEDILYVRISIYFQLKFHWEAFEIKQFAILIFHKKSLTMQMCIPKGNGDYTFCMGYLGLRT